MVRDPDRQQRLGRLERSSQQYVAFWGLVCLVGCLFFGWPMLIAWAGLAWAMNEYVQVMRGGRSSSASRKSRRSRNRNRRCCD